MNANVEPAPTKPSTRRARNSCGNVRARARTGGQDGQDRVGADGLGEVSVEAGGGGGLAVLGAVEVEAGQRDDPGLRSKELAQLPGDLEAVEARHLEIDEHDVGTSGRR